MNGYGKCTMSGLHYDYSFLSTSEPPMRCYPLLASLIVTGLLVGCPSFAQQGGLKVQRVDEEKFKLDIFDNSATFSQALAINSTGQVIGFREVADEAGTMFSQEPFFIDGKRATRVPLLDEYTNTEARALSDNGLVVGYCSRPIGHPEGSVTGFVWDSKTGAMTRLMPAGKDVSCHAQSISAAGDRITGYTAGSEPSRMLPCVWDWNQSEKKWQVETLETIEDYNPYLMSSGVTVSPDGQRIVACITVAVLPNNIYDSSLYQWQQADGQWKRELVSDDQMYVCAMNNAGQIAGVITRDAVRLPCTVDLSGKVTLIDLLPGDVSGEARGINSAGTIVGFSDDPPGVEGGPLAFVWKNGVTSELALPVETTASAAFGINEQGQIAGLLDVPDADDVSDSNSDADSAGEDAADVQTLAFRWTPKGSEKGSEKK